MNNRQGVMSSLLTVGAVGATIYGITRGIQNGTFQRLSQNLSSAMNNPTVQQMNPLQNMGNKQNDQQLANNSQTGTNNIKQQTVSNNPNNQ